MSTPRSSRKPSGLQPINNWTNQAVCGHVRPHDVQYSCVKSAATHATWVKAMPQNSSKKTTENKPGMNK